MDQCPTCSSTYKPSRRIMLEADGKACSDPWHEPVKDYNVLVLTEEDLELLHGMLIDPEIHLL